MKEVDEFYDPEKALELSKMLQLSDMDGKPIKYDIKAFLKAENNKGKRKWQ